MEEPIYALATLFFKVLKSGPDRTVRPEKPRTVHLCGFFSFKNLSTWKKQGPVWTAVEPHGSENRDQTASHGSLLPFQSEPPKKKKKKKTQRKTSFNFCSLQSKSWWWRGPIVGANGLCGGDRRNEGFRQRRKDGCCWSLRLSLVIGWIDGTAIFPP